MSDNKEGFDRSHADALIVIHKCREAGKHRHIGMDADIQAMDGNHPTVQVLDLIVPTLRRGNGFFGAPAPVTRRAKR